MLELFDLSYDELKSTRCNELFRLRKQTFSDRLGWDVVCDSGMEFDEFDNKATRYIIGMCEDKIVCSVRFSRLEHPNMITHTFRTHFDSVAIPSVGMESSRFFVDKTRARKFLGERYPVSQVLFLAMINWASHNGHTAIYTVVSRAMLAILRRSGWKINPLKEAFLSDEERIYLVSLPTDTENQIQMSQGIASTLSCSADYLRAWPLMLTK